MSNYRKDYKVVTGGTIVELERKVNDMLQASEYGWVWEPVGGITRLAAVYAQAMAKTAIPE